MGKRKASSSIGSESKKGKTTTLSVLSKEPENVKAAFRDDLFDKKVLKEYNEQYINSGPYETFNFFYRSFADRATAIAMPLFLP